MDAPPAPERRLLLVELNEFNRELLVRAAAELRLRHVARLLSLHETTTESADLPGSGFLDPWVQWVSVHTGRPASAHGIRHLGDVPDLDDPQLWERLDRRGVSSGVWGAMNASRRGAERCLFFLPDPWTFSEAAHPPELDRLLALPRYMARHYLHFSKLRLARESVRFGLPFLRPALLPRTLAELPRVAWTSVRHRGANFAPYCAAEYLSALLFLDYRRRLAPRFSILFLNGLAHVQHYYWSPGPLRDNEPLRYGLDYVDRVLGAVFAALGPGDTLMVANGFSQESTAGEPPVVMYRQVDHGLLLEALGLPPARVEALMTHDAHLFFRDADECRRARAVLEEATIDGERGFWVEPAADHPERLFYRIEFSGEADESTRLRAGGRELRFLDFFKRIVRQSGRHARRGAVFCSEPLLPEKLWNHELFDRILAFFGEDAGT